MPRARSEPPERLLDLERHLRMGEPDVLEHVILSHAQVPALVGPVLSQQQPFTACDQRPSSDGEGHEKGASRSRPAHHERLRHLWAC